MLFLMKARQIVTQLLRALGLYHSVAYARYALFAKQRGMILSCAGGVMTLDNGNRRVRVNGKDPAYIHPIIENFDYYYSGVRPAVIDGISTVDYSETRIHRLAKSGLEFMFPSLAEAEEVIDVYMRALDLRPGDAVMDLGAYAGATTYFLSKAVGQEGRVLALEPDETNFRVLQENISRHNLKNVISSPYGIWDKETTIGFQSEGNLGSAVSAVVGRASNVKNVSMITLERAADILGAKRVAGIKMDIEGSELIVLKSARDFLIKHQPRLVVEPHHVDGKLVTEEVCSLLQSYGFETELLSQGADDWPLIAARPKG
jgi:FkbM family methyltransferase